MPTGADNYELKLFGRDGGGNFYQNVLHYLVAADGSDDAFSTADFLANAFNTDVMPSLLACMSDDSTIDAIACRKIDVGGSGNTYTKVITGYGTIVKPCSTGALACNLNFYTDHVKQHGHMYLGGLAQTAYSDDGLDSAFLALVATLITKLITQETWGAAGTGNISVWSRKLSVGYPVIAITASPKPCNLPRRTRPFG